MFYLFFFRKLDNIGKQMMKCVAARFFFSQRAHTISQGWFSHFIKASVFVNGKRLMKKKEDENERRWDNFFFFFQASLAKVSFQKKLRLLQNKKAGRPYCF